MQTTSNRAAIGRPNLSEASAFHFNYINQVAGEDILSALQSQFEEPFAYLSSITEERSLYRYTPDKWSLRQVLHHMADTERIFSFRALWFARGLAGELHSFDQEIAEVNAEADTISWESHLEEMRRIRLATLSLFSNMPQAAWMRTGISGGNLFTVRAIAFITAGHFAHHIQGIREQYA
ncbi:DinB family protein [Granulicella arctica]|uniref:DinB-like domain-containing protein n=1 Tax=Granulicella arctica TaxID=940613 RepID=A0A7Y9TMA5_9BACT|nr:DinB family protein [Granulicella arctica]NYF80937.1 hypothetical protein [Granulicella arctica]